MQSDSNSKIAQEIRRIGQKIAGSKVIVEEPKPQRAFWDSLFRRAPSKPQFDFPATLEKSANVRKLQFVVD